MAVFVYWLAPRPTVNSAMGRPGLLPSHGGVVAGNILGPVLCSPGLSGRALALRSSPTLPLVLPRADKRAPSGCAGEFRANPEFFDLSHVPAHRNLFCRATVPEAAAMDHQPGRQPWPPLRAPGLRTTAQFPPSIPDFLDRPDEPRRRQPKPYFADSLPSLPRIALAAASRGRARAHQGGAAGSA